MEGKKRGRKVGSPIRENITELLYFLGEGWGYDLSKKYMSIFGRTSMRSIYYHLSKGVEIGEFKVKRVDQVEGDYSWGPKAQRTVFTLGPNSRPKGDPNVRNKIFSVLKNV